MELYFTVWLGVFGLLIGSFLNVVIARVPTGESIVTPPSHCPKCGYQLRWYDNVPVVSWVLLGGKCRGCRAPISPRYLFVEVLTSVLFLAAVKRFGFDWQLAPALLFVALIIPLIFIDAKFYFLPTPIMYGGAVAGLLLQWPGGAPALESSLKGVLYGFLVFRALEWVGWLAVRKETLGAGDKLLMGMIGAFTGAGGLFGVVMLGSAHGALWGVSARLLTGRAGPPLPPPGGAGSAASPPPSEASGGQAPVQPGASTPDGGAPAAVAVTGGEVSVASQSAHTGSSSSAAQTSAVAVMNAGPSVAPHSADASATNAATQSSPAAEGVNVAPMSAGAGSASSAAQTSAVAVMNAGPGVAPPSADAGSASSEAQPGAVAVKSAGPSVAPHSADAGSSSSAAQSSPATVMNAGPSVAQPSADTSAPNAATQSSSAAAGANVAPTSAAPAVTSSAAQPGAVAALPADDAAKPASLASPPPLRDEDGELIRTFSPSFLAPGLPWWKRVLLLPHTLLWQDIPDPILGTDEAGEEIDLWEPDASSMPLGPWLGVAALEVLLLGPWLSGLGAGTLWGGMLRVMMGRLP